MDETLDKLGETIAGALPGSITSHSVANGELTIRLEKAAKAKPRKIKLTSGIAAKVKGLLGGDKQAA